ncbi:MAG: hypothetical protein D6B25_06590 [Desulfobulbaceae bacterium]|nr:MAG: hypothetical protein D6B25_06590 [Desulfobulbaceae bacterium]
MNTKPSELYGDYSPHKSEKLIEQFATSLEQRSKPVPVFFRADDIGVSSQNFSRLLKLFEHYEVPLCLAVVPGWLTDTRMKTLRAICDPESELWCFHQHGWLHRNHEQQGKKCEFGSSRHTDDITHDLLNGKRRLESILGNTVFQPFFTPPWNRCSDETIDQLAALGFKGISRDQAKRKNPSLLPDFAINIDLHTRREQSADLGFAALGQELMRGLEQNMLGFMIHHQRMNDHAFDLLARVLYQCQCNRLINPAHFTTLYKRSSAP